MQKFVKNFQRELLCSKRNKGLTDTIIGVEESCWSSYFLGRWWLLENVEILLAGKW